MRPVLILVYLSISIPDCYCKLYKVILDSANVCKDPDLPYASPLPINLTLEVFNNSKGATVLGGNVIIENDIQGKNYKAYFAVGSETAAGISWKLKMKALDCYSSIVRGILTSAGVPLKRCVVKKGRYAIKDVDVDGMDSKVIAAVTRNFGQYVVKLSIFDKTQTLLCLEIHVAVQALKKQRGPRRG